jgi:hypothetical protein
MTDTATRIVADAVEGLAVLDAQIEAMREQKKGLGVAIAQALEQRKPLARIVAAAAERKPRKSRSNGDTPS